MRDPQCHFLLGKHRGPYWICMSNDMKIKLCTKHRELADHISEEPLIWMPQLIPEEKLVGHVVDGVIKHVIEDDEVYEVQEDGKTVAVVVSAERYEDLVRRSGAHGFSPTDVVTTNVFDIQEENDGDPQH